MNDMDHTWVCDPSLHTHRGPMMLAEREANKRGGPNYANEEKRQKTWWTQRRTLNKHITGRFLVSCINTNTTHRRYAT